MPNSSVFAQQIKQFSVTSEEVMASFDEKREETQRVKAVLRENNYPLTFINNCERALTRKPADINFNGFVVLPYAHDVSERIGRVLKRQQVGVSYRPQVTSNFHVLKS